MTFPLSPHPNVGPVVVLACFLACTSPEDRETTVEDSPSVLQPRCDSVATAESPGMVIGSTGDAPDQVWFGRIADAAFLKDGGFVVADPQGHVLHLFDPAGRRTAILGGKGDGPGEFSGLMGSVHSLGDSIVVFETSRQLWTVFDGEGTFLETIRFDLGSRGQTLGVLGDRSVVVAHPSSFPMDVVARDTVELKRFSLVTGELLGTLGSYPGAERYGTISGGFSVFPLPFGRSSTFDVWPEEGLIAVGTADSSAVVLLHSDGRPAGEVTIPLSPRVVTPEMIAAWREARPAAAAALEEIEFPESTPPYAAVTADHAGYLWVQEPEIPEATESRHVVLRSDGSVAEEVGLPVGARVLDVNEQAALVRLEDDLGVQRVAIYSRRCFR